MLIPEYTRSGYGQDLRFQSILTPFGEENGKQKDGKSLKLLKKKTMTPTFTEMFATFSFS